MRMASGAALILFVAPHVVLSQALEGVWRGRITDRQQQPVEFELLLAGPGAQPAGRLQPLGRGAVTPFFVDNATLSPEGTVRIDIQTLRISIEGRLEAQGQVIQAKWTQFDKESQTVQLTRVPSATPPTFFDPLVELRIPKSPTAFRANGAYRLDYEIHVVNHTEQHLDLQKVEIKIADKVSTLEGEALAAQTVSYGVSIPPRRVA